MPAVAGRQRDRKARAQFASGPFVLCRNKRGNSRQRTGYILMPEHSLLILNVEAPVKSHCRIMQRVGGVYATITQARPELYSEPEQKGI